MGTLFYTQKFMNILLPMEIQQQFSWEFHGDSMDYCPVVQIPCNGCSSRHQEVVDNLVGITDISLCIVDSLNTTGH